MAREAIIDIGSSKILGTSWSIDREGDLSIDALSNVEYAGLKYGMTIDHEDLRTAIYKCLDEVQDEINKDVESVVIGVPGAFCSVLCCDSAAEFREPTLISEAIINKMSMDSIADVKMEGYIKIHSLPFRYVCDGEKNSSLPEQKEATNIEVLFAHIFASEDFIASVEEALYESQYKVRKYVATFLAQSMTTIPEKEREKGSILIDVGGNFTDVTIIQYGVPISVGTVPIGGRHITSDIAYVLDCDHKTAEAIKRQYVFGLDYEDSSESVRKADGTIQEVSTKHIQDIIEARAGEIIDLASEQITQAEFEIGDSAVVYLTGGGLAMLRGGLEFAQKKLLFPVRSTLPAMPRKSTFVTASLFSIADYESLSEGYEDDKIKSSWRDKPFFKKILHFFTE